MKTKRPVKERANYYDYHLVAVVILLICFGLVMLYSTSAYTAQERYEDDMHFFFTQALISGVCIAAVLFFSKAKWFDYHILYNFSPLIYAAAMILMFMVMVTPLGRTVNGARRWLQLGIQFQPSEIAKIAAVTFMPRLFMKLGRESQKPRGFWIMFIVGLFLGLGAFIFTDNLSTGLIIGGITMLMLFMVYPRKKWFYVLGIFILAVLIMGKPVLQSLIGSGEISTDDFRLKRILVWLEPEQYSREGGYQIMQALYAIGSGGFFGKGLGNSVQKLGPVPEAQNDMIFSIICEELGVFGGLVILVLFGYLLYRLFAIAQNAPDFYGCMVVSGIFFHIALQVTLNVCVVLNWIPTTGITLPFFSYGGTSILFLMIEIGIALSVSRQITFRE